MRVLQHLQVASSLPPSSTSTRSTDTRSCAYFSTSRWPPLRRHRARVLVPRAPVLVSVLQHLQMASSRRLRARPLAPRTPVLVRVLQHLQVASLRRLQARVLVPRTPILTRPLQHLQVASSRRLRARQLVPQTPVLVRVLQHLQVASSRRLSSTSTRPTDTRSRARTSAPPPGGLLRRLRARSLVPRAPVLVRILQHLQVASSRRP